MLKYKRVLLKISGEALKGGQGEQLGIDPRIVKSIALQVKEIYDLGVQIGIVCGAGNIWRGRDAFELGMERAQADYMGMLGTMLNGLALQDALESINIPTRVMSAIKCDEVAEPYIRRKALNHLDRGLVTIFVGGTGSPYFSTDTAAALRAAEINADVILMAKNGTEGVFDKDPRKFKDAKMYEELSIDKLLEFKLEVMDLTSATLCQDNNLPIIVFDMNKAGNIKKAVLGEKIGTYII